MKPVIVVHHHEITLKRGNRKYFERQLLVNTKNALAGLIASGKIGGGYGRFIIDLDTENNVDAVTAQLKTVFGLANICVGLRVDQDLATFCSAADTLLSNKTFKTIRVDARRVDKRFPQTSTEVNVHVGKYLCDKYGVRADLSNPDETVYVEIVNSTAYVYCSKLKGAGGLPVGVSGKVAVMLSAGFDSPVASYMMMKRGATAIFVHFHSYPYVTRDSVDQVRQLVEVLTKYQFDSKLSIVPFGEAQQEIVARTPPPLRVILYRRMMVRITEAIALKEKAQAIVTGESLGQVASQTLRNIKVINDAATLPILRPLVGMDKEEIIELSRLIGTHDISKEPYDDCCSFLTPRSPETWANPMDVAVAEENLDTPNIVSMCLHKVGLEKFTSEKEPAS